MKIIDYSRFAIIQTAFLGDIALTLPLADAIRNVHPTAEIHFITTPAGAQITACSESIDFTHVFDKRNAHRSVAALKGFADTLSHFSIDCVLSPHRSLRSTLLMHFIHPAISVGYTTNTLAILYSKRIHYPIHLHEVERNLSLLGVFDETSNVALAKAQRPRIRIEENDSLAVLQTVANIRGKNSGSALIVLAPGSVWPTKRWKDEYFVETAQLLQRKGYTCIYVGGKEDEHLCSRLARLSGSVSLAGKTSIAQTLALLQQCGALITNDSAPTHLGWIAGCPTLTIYGPTSPMFGFSPRGEQDFSIENSTIECRPCSIHGAKECPLGTHVCMNSITQLMVYRAVLDMLDEKQKSQPIR